MEKPIIFTEKVSIGISACCFGCPVRYNGKGTDVLSFIGRERVDFKWCPVCPESAAGLGVPRNPIHLSGGDGNSIWSGEAQIKNRNGQKITEVMKEGAIASMDTLRRAGAIAYIYMEGSPSCGVYKTSLKKQKRGNPPGVFGALLLENGFFLIPAEDVQSPLKWWDWRRRLLAFAWLNEQNISTKNEAFEVWHNLKFLCQELDNAWAREVGKKLANITDESAKEYFQSLKKEILDLLRKPSTTAKIKNSLWKNYSHFRKSKGETIDGVNSPEFLRNITSIAKELTLVERKSVEEGFIFGTSPIIYRDKKRF